MGGGDTLLILITVILYPFVWIGVLGYRSIPTIHHNNEDLLGFRLEKILQKLDQRFYNRWVPPLMLSFLTFAAYSYWNWSALDPSHYLQRLILFIVFLLTWRAVTQDRDLVAKTSDYPARLLLIALSVAAL